MKYDVAALGRRAQRPAGIREVTRIDVDLVQNLGIDTLELIAVVARVVAHERADRGASADEMLDKCQTDELTCTGDEHAAT